MSIRKISVVDQAEEAVRQMADGLGGGTPLPSIRDLSQVLKVSAPTVQIALRRLERAGCVRKSGVNQPYLVAGGKRGQGRPAGRKLLFLTNEPWDELTVSARSILGKLSIALAKDGFSVDHARLGFAEARKPRVAWKRLLAAHHPTHLLVVGANPAIAKWALQTGLPHIFLGSPGMTSEVSVVSRDLRESVVDAVRRLRALGHRRIVIPVFNRNECLVPQLQEAMAEGMGIHVDTVKSGGLVPFTRSENKADLRGSLLDSLERHRPTALLSLNWRNHLLISSSLAERGLRVPRDISVICMADDRDMEWCIPTTAHYSVRTADYVRQIQKWACRNVADAAAPVGTIRQRWNDGGSIGPAPRSA